ncbi:MAG: hypothetical protein LBG18_07815 [Mediterranea sp.]|jgi:hypothetical protein|nr:hypothetical protein [Mediterranea sp.]
MELNAVFNILCSSFAFIVSISAMVLSYHTSWIIHTFHKLQDSLSIAKTDEEKKKARKEIDLFIGKYLKV